MWGLIVVGLIWYGLFGKNDPKTVKKVQDNKKKSGCLPLLIIFFVLSALSSWIPGLFGLAVAAMALGLPIMLISKLISAANKEATRRKSPEYKNISESFNLTQSVSKRQKILKKFNEDYELNLNQEQMERIVDASYMSYSWEKEIYDMTKSYNHPSEWFKCDTAWLRAYLRAFPMMNITSDFEMQRAIVEDAFRQILEELPPGDFLTIDAAIQETNRRFFTMFDETSYMIMFRHMQTKGMKLQIPNGLHRSQESEADRLAREYDEKVAEEAKRRKTRAVHSAGTATGATSGAGTTGRSGAGVGRTDRSGAGAGKSGRAGVGASAGAPSRSESEVTSEDSVGAEIGVAGAKAGRTGAKAGATSRAGASAGTAGRSGAGGKADSDEDRDFEPVLPDDPEAADALAELMGDDAEREAALDELQAFAEEQMGSLSDAELERLIRAYDRMMKEEAENKASGSEDDGADDGTRRGY